MKCIRLHSLGIEKVQCLCTMYTVHSPIAWYFESSFHSAIFPLDLNIFKKSVRTQKSSRTSYIFPCMSSKYTLPFVPFAFHWTILCCLVTLAWSPVNLVSQGVFPPLKVILKVSPKRFQQESVTDENVMNCTEKHFFAIWKENSWEYFKMPWSVYSDCGVTGLKKSISRPPPYFFI